MISIQSIAVENLRGYEHTQLFLKKMTVLVGENNEGKSSMLKMLERFMQIPPKFWEGDIDLSDEEFRFWYPANDARKKARRFTVNVKFSDGRQARRFGPTIQGVLPLRFAISSSGICRLNTGAPKKNEKHDPRAAELLLRLQEEVQLVLLPPVRDAKSSTFAEKVSRGVKEQLNLKIGHSKQAGAPKEYRLAKDAIRKIEEIVALHSGELSRSNDSPLASMLKSSEVRVELFPKDIYSLIDKSLSVYLSTGNHDKLKVLPGEVGNGLQSLIDINLTVESILKGSGGGSIILIIEEPEAFLHPSAQRQFMQFLRRALVEKVGSAILTTHSPIIVDEAKYEEIVLVRNQKHYAPKDVPADRASINTSLMTAATSEVFFARTVVLLEGEGDRAFFNTLLRRIKNKATVCPELAGLVFQVTGGCTFYSPWLKLVRSYKGSGDHPFTCVWIMDGDAASANPDRPVLRAARDCGFNLHATETQVIVDFGNLAWEDSVRKFGSASAANDVLSKHGGFLFCCDLEWALFNGSSDGTVSKIRDALSIAGIEKRGDSVTLARRLGSKIRDGKSSDGAKKHPYIRALIAEQLELSALPPEIYAALYRILTECYISSTSEVEALFKACGIASGNATG
jgi:predicted ATP-dependent endonuclease of OLD family